MALTECKVKNEDFDNMDIASLSDRPSADGMSAQMLKERFDAGAKRVIMPKFNQLVETLAGAEGADNIGAAAIEGLSGYTVQQILVAIKLLLDDKKSIESADREIAQKFDAAEAQALVKEVTFSEGSGVFTITKYDGSVQTYDTALEKVALDVRLDGQQFVLTLADGTEQRVDLSAFITQAEVKNSDTITLAIESGVIVARLASGSVTMAHLNPEVTAYIEAKEQSAANSAASASVSEQNALNSASSAEQSHQNAKTCQEQACLCATQAEISRQAAATSESNAKASEQAAKQSETKSATSEANAKASEQNAATSESNASGYEQGALENAQTAEQAAETAVNAMNNASASEQNAKASETASQTNKEASDTSANSAAESARAAAESAKRAEEEANRAADNAGGDFATRSELQAHTTAENPHGVTAKQIGAVTSVNGIAVDENGNITLTEEKLSEILADIFAKYLPLDGSAPMTGTLKTSNGGVAGSSNILMLRSEANNDAEATRFGIQSLSRASLNESIVFWSNSTGVATRYTMIGTHNKPSGIYSGNGDVTTRTINIGGMTNLLLVRSSGLTIALVSDKGAVVFSPNGKGMWYLTTSQCKFAGGVLTIASADAGINYSGQSYHYNML